MTERPDQSIGPEQGSEPYYDLMGLVSKKFQPWHGVVIGATLSLALYAATQQGPFKRQLLRTAAKLPPEIYDAVLRDTLTSKIIPIGENHDQKKIEELEELFAQKGRQKRSFDISLLQPFVNGRQIIDGTRLPANLRGMTVTTTFELVGERNPGHAGIYVARLVGNERLRPADVGSAQRK